MISLRPTLQAARAGRSLFTTAPAALVGCMRLLSPPHRKPLFCTAFSSLRSAFQRVYFLRSAPHLASLWCSVSVVGMNSISPHTHLRIVKTKCTSPPVNPLKLRHGPTAARSALGAAPRAKTVCLRPVWALSEWPPPPPPVQYASHDPADRASAQEARQRSATAGA